VVGVRILKKLSHKGEMKRMKKRYKIEVNHDGPLFVNSDFDEIEKELCINDMVIDLDKWTSFIYVWIDSKDYDKGER